MKIAHLSSQSTWRGGEQQIFYLHEELTMREIDSIVFVKKHSVLSGRLKNAGLSYKAFAFRSSYDLITAWKIRSQVNKKQIDIVHAHTAKAHTLAIIAVLMGMKSKIVVSRRVDVPVKKNWFSRYKYNHSSVSSIICVSQEIERIMSLGLKDQSRLTTVYSGINLTRFSDVKPGTLRKEYKIDKKARIIGNVSALAKHKDIFTFLCVAKKLILQRSDLQFVIVGEGEERSQVEKQIKELDLTNYVLLTGFREDIPEILADMDILLFTSITEGLGTTLLDALASGTPVVSTKAGGIPEILKVNSCGLLCDVGDIDALSEQVNRILNDNNLRKSLVERGFQTASAFSKTVTADQTIANYYSVLSNAI